MTNSLRAIRFGALAFAASSILTGCGALSPLGDAVIPNFSDENLGNPMAGFVPVGGSAPVANQGAGLAFSATQPVAAAQPQPFNLNAQPAPASTGLLDQAASSGVNSADAALLDAALDVSPSQMGSSGAATGLLADSLIGLIGFEDSSVSSSPSAADNALMAAAGVSVPTPTSLADAGLPRAPIVSSIDATETAFQVLSPADAQLLLEGGGAIRYTSTERADFQTPYFSGRANAVQGLAPTPGYTAVGTSPAVAVSVPDAGPNSSGFSFESAEIPRTTLRTNQALIPIYGGTQRLAIQPTSGTIRPGYAQFRAGSIEFTLTFPAQIAVSQLYAPSTPAVTMTMRNLDSVPKTFQPDNILNQFPPFQIYRWTGSIWASLTMDVAYNIDRQGISAPVTLQPGQATTRSEPMAKLALLPLKVELPPTESLAIRLQIPGQPDAFTMVDSGYIPIRVTDGGGFPMATTLTADANPAFVLVDGSISLPTTVLTR